MSYTQFDYKIQTVSEGTGYNWLFLPGGPGLGAQYLFEFSKQLALPGTVSLVDFPLDGANQHGSLNIKQWQKGLFDLIQTIPNPILVTHSFSGMFALSLLEQHESLAGLVLMNTTTTNSFFQHVSEMQRKHDLPDLASAAAAFHLHRCKANFQRFWQDYKYYCFTQGEIVLGEKLMELFAYNDKSYYFAVQNFYSQFQYQQKQYSFPVLTIASENDYVCPPRIFIDNKNYQAKNILNKIIPEAGHFPWLLHFEKVQNCFREFIEKYLQVEN